ncbi:WhiB family transcriptional regulator [Streptomyces sp. NPDC002409]|uniref:WhiB family transcriptional regulator n=1 Tax=Streptomyces misionensis TaxID=67331 RepID=UPI0036BB5648
MPRPGRYWPDTRHGNSPRPAHWDRRAACTSAPLQIFFPEGDAAAVHSATEEAKAYCRACPVTGRCQIESLERAEPYGVWGGLDEDERREILRAARARARQGAVDGPAPAAAAA